MGLLGLANLGGVLPTFASESEANAIRAANARWHSFAVDLACASGCIVHYEAAQQVEHVGLDVEPLMVAEHGGIGLLRIGASDGPSVLLLPEDFLATEQVSTAYLQVGLKEPRRLAQDIVASATFGDLAPPCEPAESGAHSAEQGQAAPSGLGALLRETAVLIPVFMQHGSREPRAGRAPVGSATRNFPVRWEDAAAAAPRAAGPYPASHPSVRAITGWLNSASDCAGVVIVRKKLRGAKSNSSYRSGTLEAFCDEVLQLSVRETLNDGTIAALSESLRQTPRLTFHEPEWRRLGSTNWSLEVTVERGGDHGSLGDAVLLSATPEKGEVVLTAAAAASGSETLELLPLQTRGVLLPNMTVGASRRLRLFFTESVVEDPLSGAEATKVGGPLTPRVNLEAVAPRARKAVLRSQSPV